MTSKHDLYTAPTLPLCRGPCLFRIWRANCRPVDWQQRALMSLALARNYLKTFPFKVNNLSRVFLQPAAADNKLLGGASSGTERNGTGRNGTENKFPEHDSWHLCRLVCHDAVVCSSSSSWPPSLAQFVQRLPASAFLSTSPFSLSHAQRPLINALAKKAAHLFVVLPSARCWRRNFYNEKLSAHKMKSRRWQLTGRESCLPHTLPRLLYGLRNGLDC